jgi:RNA polymerase sigma factor (sigma-70 family)
VEVRVAVSDADFVQLAREGEVAALGALLERHRARLYALALSMLRDRDEAHDAVQDTFLLALRRLDDLREPASAGAWLRAIVRNACLTRLRRTREVLGDVPDRAGVVDAGPEAVLDGLALRDWVLTSVNQLTEDMRATVMLRFFTSRTSYAEIAAILGVPLGTVRSRLNQAKRQLADSILDAAAAVHTDHTELVRQRWQEWAGAIDQMDREGVARLYFVDCAPDVIVDNPGAGYRTRGIQGERGNVEEGLDIGVHLRPTGIVASPGITILEATYENPPDHPGHCPPLHTEIRIHPGGQTDRLILHFGSPALDRSVKETSRTTLDF